jgi:hypothetical protein
MKTFDWLLLLAALAGAGARRLLTGPDPAA